MRVVALFGLGGRAPYRRNRRTRLAAWQVVSPVLSDTSFVARPRQKGQAFIAEHQSCSRLLATADNPRPDARMVADRLYFAGQRPVHALR